MDKLGGFHTYLNAQAEEYMISNTDIRYFFDTYYDNFMHSLAWEDHLLEPASREEWHATLRSMCRRPAATLCGQSDTA